MVQPDEGRQREREAMAEVASVLREMQLDTKAGLAPARVSAPLDSRHHSKEAAGSFTGEIGVTKADACKEEVARTVEIVGTEAKVGNKEAFGKGVITEEDWINFVFLTGPPAGIKSKAAEATGITKERVPDSFIDILKNRHLFRKLPPASRFGLAHSMFPDLRDQYLKLMTRRNYCVDLHLDVRRQLKKKGFAEVGVDFTDGVKKLFILPKH